jgi:hypothetical protein
MAVIINGVIMIVLGAGIYFGAQVFPPRREIWERCGAYVFTAGISMWAMVMLELTFIA